MSPTHCFVALALLVFGISAAAGQTVDPRTDAPLHLGPFYVTPVLVLSRLGVDTNVFNTSGEQQSDFIVTGGPRIDVAIPIRRFVFTADTVTDLVYYHGFANQRGMNFDMSLRGEVQLPKLTFVVEDSFLNTRQRPNFEIDVRARRQENVLMGALSVDVSRRMALEVAANGSKRKYSGDDLAGARLARALNRDALGASGSMRFLVSPLTSIRLTVETQSERFEFAPTRDHDSWSLVPSVHFNPRALISGSAAVGYRTLRGVDELLPDYRGPVASTDLNYQFLVSTTIGFTLQRDVEFSMEVAEPYYVSTGFGFSFRHQLTPPLSIGVGTERHNLAYRQFVSGVIENSSESRVDTIRRYSVTLSRRLSRATEIGFDISHYSRLSENVALRDYNGLLAGMTITYEY